MSTSSELSLTWTDDEIRVLPGMMLVEPYKPDKQISIVADIIEMVERLPSNIKAKVIKLGAVKHDPGFGPGDHVCLIPHGGTIIRMGRDLPMRMVVPIKDALGVWED